MSGRISALAFLAVSAATAVQAQVKVEGMPEPAKEAPSIEEVLERAAASREDREAVERSTALTIAGGVSLGAYQAGFLYYYTRFLQEYAKAYDNAARQYISREPFAPLTVVTGASAGSINALLAALTACSRPIDVPEDSPFWDVWMRIGLAELRPTSKGQRSLFAEKARDDVAKRVRELWQQSERWSTSDCAVQVGISATRLTARTIQIGPLTSNSRQTEKFVFQVAKKGAGPPGLEGVEVPESENLDRRFYPQLGWGERPELSDVTDLLLASSAFPFFFSPRLLHYRLFEDPSQAATTDAGYFIDGGVLDNQPVKLARALLRWKGLKAAGPGAVDQIYVDTSAVAYGTSAEPEQPIVDATPVAQYGHFLADYVSAAGQAEFLEAAEDKEFAKRLAVPQRTLPVAGEHMMHFAAFAERVFRRNDFYVGMVDASQFLARNSRQYQMLVRTRANQRKASDGATAEPDPVPIASREYTCYRRSMLSGRQDACSGIDPRLLKVLNACLELKTRILLGDKRADLADVFFEQLYASGFQYEDFAPGKRLHAREVRSEFRQVLEEGIVAVSDAHDRMTGYVVKSVGLEIGNAALLHRGPDHFTAFGASNRRGFDVTYSPALFADRWRPSVALQIFNFDLGAVQYAPGSQSTLAPSRPGQRSIQNQPAVGVNLGLHPRLTYSVPLSAAIQLEFGIGYTAAVRLTSDWTNSFVMLRQGPVASATLLGFERLYLDLSLVEYIDKWSIVADAYQRADIIPVLGRRGYDLLLGLGWRFY